MSPSLKSTTLILVFLPALLLGCSIFATTEPSLPTPAETSILPIETAVVTTTAGPHIETAIVNEIISDTPDAATELAEPRPTDEVPKLIAPNYPAWSTNFRVTSLENFWGAWSPVNGQMAGIQYSSPLTASLVLLDDPTAAMAGTTMSTTLIWLEARYGGPRTVSRFSFGALSAAGRVRCSWKKTAISGWLTWPH